MFRLPVDDELELRLLEQAHVEALHALVCANRDHLARWMPWAVAPTLEGQRGFVLAGLQQFARGDGFQCGLWADGELVGAVGLHYLKRRIGATEIGYWLAEAAQGRGLMTRAVRGLLAALFGDAGLRRAEIRCHPDNARSRAVPERLRFRQEGVLRAVADFNGEPHDQVVYGLLREEWQAAGGPPGGPARRTGRGAR